MFPTLKGKVWDGKKTLVEEGVTRKYMGDWVDGPGGQTSEQCDDEDDEDDLGPPPVVAHRQTRSFGGERVFLRRLD